MEPLTAFVGTKNRDRKKMKKLILEIVLFTVFVAPGFADENQNRQDAIAFIKESETTLQNFNNDPELQWFRNHFRRARGILIIPTQVKGGFVFGGSGGTGVLFRHDFENNRWSYPAFYSMGSVSVGFQAGVEVAEVVLLIMTERGMDAFLSSKMQLGSDASIALGPVGIGTQAATTDVLQYSRAKGLFLGLTLEGSIVSTRNALNEAYYGRPVSPVEIYIKGAVNNSQADSIRYKLSTLEKKP